MPKKNQAAFIIENESIRKIRAALLDYKIGLEEAYEVSLRQHENALEQARGLHEYAKAVTSAERREFEELQSRPVSEMGDQEREKWRSSYAILQTRVSTRRREWRESGKPDEFQARHQVERLEVEGQCYPEDIDFGTTRFSPQDSVPFPSGKEGEELSNYLRRASERLTEELLQIKKTAKDGDLPVAVYRVFPPNLGTDLPGLANPRGTLTLLEHSLVTDAMKMLDLLEASLPKRGSVSPTLPTKEPVSLGQIDVVVYNQEQVVCRSTDEQTWKIYRKDFRGETVWLRFLDFVISREPGKLNAPDDIKEFKKWKKEYFQRNKENPSEELLKTKAMEFKRTRKTWIRNSYRVGDRLKELLPLEPESKPVSSENNIFRLAFRSVRSTFSNDPRKFE